MTINVGEFLERFKRKKLKDYEQEIDIKLARVEPLLEEYYQSSESTREFSTRHGMFDIEMYALLKRYRMPLRPIPDKILKKARRLAVQTKGNTLCDCNQCWFCITYKKELKKEEQVVVAT